MGVWMQSVLARGEGHHRVGSFMGALAVTVSLLASTLALVSFTATPAGAVTPTPTTYAATTLSNAGATLNATVNPGGTATTLTFCYASSAITISGGNCTSSGTVSYATATPATSSSATTTSFFAPITGLTAGTTYSYAAGASQAAGTTAWSTPSSFTTLTGGPFVCTPNFYQENSSFLWKFNPATQTYAKVNLSAQATSLNGIGYDTQNNYLYGVGGSHHLSDWVRRKRDRRRDAHEHSEHRWGLPPRHQLPADGQRERHV